MKVDDIITEEKEAGGRRQEAKVDDIITEEKVSLQANIWSPD